jgi:DNA helicase-2/ATP-dependent DNA helicase PcrA
MDEYLARMAETVFEASDYSFGRFSAKSDWIQSRFAAYRKHPIKQRLQMIADDIYDRFEADNLIS